MGIEAKTTAYGLKVDVFSFGISAAEVTKQEQFSVSYLASLHRQMCLKHLCLLALDAAQVFSGATSIGIRSSKAIMILKTTDSRVLFLQVAASFNAQSLSQGAPRKYVRLIGEGMAHG